MDSCGHVSFFTAGVTYLSHCGFTVVSLWSEPKPKPGSKKKLVQDSCCFDGKQTIDQAARAEKTWTYVGNAFTTSECHGSNILILSKSGLMWFCK
jgi:hypothetical protein